MHSIRFSILLGSVLIVIAYSCTHNNDITRRLSAVDSLLQVNPVAAWDSLQTIDTSHTCQCQSDDAYYRLLRTIGQHKNRIPFSSDSTIASSREWFVSNSNDCYNQARSLFYNGLVLYTLSADDSTAYCYMRDAYQIIEDGFIKDDRLAALVCAYLGKISDYHHSNYPEAIRYYSKAVTYETRLDNPRNLISDLCDLLVCYVKAKQFEDAEKTLFALDSTLGMHPELNIEKTKNAKALYYMYAKSDLDSASYYVSSWNPPAGSLGAKYGLLADYYKKTGQLDSAIHYEKSAYLNKRKNDSIYFQAYFYQLSDLYQQQGRADSSVHYARLAYQSLRGVMDQRTEKRILELEKKYDVAARDAALEKAQHQRNLLAVIAVAFILLSAGAGGILYTRNRKMAAERLTRSVIHAAAKTHQNTLSQLRELRKKPKSRTVQSLQEDIGTITRDIQRKFSQNFADALEQNLDTLPARTRKAAEKLPGERAKIVFILSEMGYSDAEIAEFTCTSVDSVRTLGNKNQRTLSGTETKTEEEA